MMKKLNMKIWAGAMAMILLVSSCDDFLDVNDNPNLATSSTPQLTLPAAIVGSASISSQYNSYGAHFGGYMANAGGFSGFGTLLSYNLSPSDYNALWVNTYQNPLMDLKYVLGLTEVTATDSTWGYFNACANIMMAYNYQKLVDTFNDVPYSEALQGDAGNLTPGYDVAADIYADLIVKLDEAVAMIDGTQTGHHNGTIFPVRMNLGSDPLYGAVADPTLAQHDAQMAEWKKFAKTLKLKMLVRTNAAVAAFNDPRFDPAYMDPINTGVDGNIRPWLNGIGFITDDAIVDPGYETNRPNPAWAAWGRTIAGNLSNSSRIPTKFAYGFYANQFDNGQTLTTPPVLNAKILDAGRGQVIFNGFNPTQSFTTTPTNQLGNEVGNPPILAGQVTWAGSVITGLGVLKGPAMGQPLILLAEQKFLLAEAQLTGKLAGAFATSYAEGITASFTYLYKDQAEVVNVATPIATRVATYNTANAGNRLVDISLAADDAQRLEAIITQKYIAVNMIHSDEGYNEYRRTGYPVTVRNGAAHLDIASNKSTITERPDGLPTRVMYPSSEASYNSANYRVIDYRGGDRIFWDPN